VFSTFWNAAGKTATNTDGAAERMSSGDVVTAGRTPVLTEGGRQQSYLAANRLELLVWGSIQWYRKKSSWEMVIEFHIPAHGPSNNKTRTAVRMPGSLHGVFCPRTIFAGR